MIQYQYHSLVQPSLSRLLARHPVPLLQVAAGLRAEASKRQTQLENVSGQLEAKAQQLAEQVNGERAKREAQQVQQDSGEEGWPSFLHVSCSFLNLIAIHVKEGRGSSTCIVVLLGCGIAKMLEIQELGS